MNINWAERATEGDGLYGKRGVFMPMPFGGVIQKPNQLPPIPDDVVA